jgi:hypothetical protein
LLVHDVPFSPGSRSAPKTPAAATLAAVDEYDRYQDLTLGVLAEAGTHLVHDVGDLFDELATTAFELPDARLVGGGKLADGG